GRSLTANIDVEPETLHFLDQHVKRFRSARFERVITLDDGFINPGAPLHVVGLYSQQFLKGVSGAVSFQRPNLHFAETLAAILRFAAQRLLRDQRVRTNRTRVDFIGHEVTELHHVDVADHYFLIKGIASAPIEQPGLAIFLHPTEALDFLRVLQILADFGFSDAVEDGRRDSETERFCGHTKMGFEHLTDIHTAWHTQRIKHDFHRRSIRQKRHIFFRHDARDHALVAVAPSHLVANRKLALARDVNFYLLNDTGID